jgi:methylglutamate dehydrogenase subunit D
VSNPETGSGAMQPKPRSPLAGHWRPGRQGADGATPITIAERQAAIVNVQARKGRAGDLAARLGASLALELPAAGHASRTATHAAIALAPDTWLFIEPGLALDFAARIATLAGDAGAVSDQTGGKVCLRLSGSRTRDALDKICRIDLDPRVFGDGRAAVTMVAHVACAIVQIDATPTYDLIVPSSFALTVLEGIEMAAEEFGYVLV